jgi:hypothetical protein
MTWKKWVFFQCHVGVFGGHRNAAKTAEIISRVAWWNTMRKDVEEWVDGCSNCIRNRKVPTKQEAVAVKPSKLEAWEEVMVDCGGPSNPPDASGNIYTLTYMCLLCHGVLLEPGTKLAHSELRRMFARCVFRSGTLPLMVRSDRGSEFKNALMKEFTSLVGIRQRFGTPWRPNGAGCRRESSSRSAEIPVASDERHHEG